MARKPHHLHQTLAHDVINKVRSVRAKPCAISFIKWLSKMLVQFREYGISPHMCAIMTSYIKCKTIYPPSKVQPVFQYIKSSNDSILCITCVIYCTTSCESTRCPSRAKLGASKWNQSCQIKQDQCSQGIVFLRSYKVSCYLRWNPYI